MTKDLSNDRHPAYSTKHMSKYLVLLNLAWQNSFVYRTSLFFWRFRQFLSTLMSLTIWTVIFSNQGQVFEYSEAEMISYVLLISVLQSVILATSLNGLADRIYSGQISQLLIKPVSILGYLLGEDLADKMKNVLFAVVEIGILALIFQPQLPTPTLAHLALGVVGIGLGLALYFGINILFGTLGFWAPHTWGPRFLFFMFLDFTAGKLFPLDILPEFIQKVIYVTPLPYLSYIQIQTLMGRFTIQESITSLLGATAWVVGLWVLVRYIWHKGMKEYTAAGI